MSSAVATTEVKPAPPEIEKIKVKVDGREVARPLSEMKIAAGPQH